MTAHDDQALPLPGLEDLPGHAPPLIHSLRRTIAALNTDGLLEEHHALELQAAHLLARAAEAKVASGRMSTLAGDVELLLKIKALIVGEDGEESIDDQLRAAMEEAARMMDGPEVKAGP